MHHRTCFWLAATFLLAPWRVTISTAPAAAPFLWPLGQSDFTPDVMNTSFGPRLNKAQWDFHDGVDLPAPIGTPIHAARDGTVYRAGPADSTYSSRHVILRVNDPNGGWLYLVHLHLDSIAAGITDGAPVTQGQVIGAVGDNDASFPHLHFEVRKGASTEISSVHPLGYFPYTNTVNFSAPTNAMLNRLSGQLAARLTFGAPSRLEGDLLRVEVDLRSGTNVLAARVADFNDKTTVNDTIGDGWVYVNDIGVEGYQAPDMVGDGRTDLKYGVLLRTLPESCDNLVARVIAVGSNVVTSLPLALTDRPLVEERLSFEDGALPPPGWTKVISSGLSLQLSTNTASAFEGMCGLLATDSNPTTNSQQRACIEFPLPAGASSRFEWVAEAWIKPVALGLPDGGFIYPLAFMSTTRTIAAARIRNEGGVLVVGLAARNPDFSCGNQDCFTGDSGTFTGPWLDVWRWWRLRVSRLGMREATAALYIDGVEVSRLTWDNTTYEMNRLRAGLALTDDGVTAATATDQLRLSESTPAELERVDLTHAGNSMTLHWSGGLAPFQVQVKTNLTGVLWQSIGVPTMATNAAVTNTDEAGFYRVIGQ